MDDDRLDAVVAMDDAVRKPTAKPLSAWPWRTRSPFGDERLRVMSPRRFSMTAAFNTEVAARAPRGQPAASAVRSTQLPRVRPVTGPMGVLLPAAKKV